MKTEEGLATLRAACEIALRDDRTGKMLAKAIAASESGDVDSALADLKSLLDVNSRCVDASVLKGSLLMHDRGQRAMAMRSFSRVVARDASSALALWYMALDAAERGEALPLSMSLLQAATQAVPEDSFVSLTLAWMQGALGRWGATVHSLAPEDASVPRRLVCDSIASFLIASCRPKGKSASHQARGRRLRCLLEITGAVPGVEELNSGAMVREASAESADTAMREGETCRHLLNPALATYRTRFGERVAGQYAEHFLRMILWPLIAEEARRTSEMGLAEHLRSIRRGARVPTDMVEIPEGNYRIGSTAPTGPNPQRIACLKGFLIDRYPVTHRQWREFRPDYQIPSGQEDHPVVNVDAVQAALYARWHGKRLPTEEEWEAAARGPEGRTFPWGNQAAPNHANCADRKPRGTTPVTAFPGGASPFGVLDMVGNTMEWVETWYPAEAGGQFRRIVKGGGCGVPAKNLACWMQGAQPPHQKQPTLGFRCAMDLYEAEFVPVDDQAAADPRSSNRGLYLCSQVNLRRR